MDQRRSGANGILGAHDRGQHFVIDRHQFRRVARLCFRLGDDYRDALSDIAHPALCQGRPLGAGARGPAHILGHDLGIERAETIGRPILARQHGEDAGHPLRRGLVDGADPGVGVRRINEDGLRLAGEIDIRDIAAAPCQKARVLLACDGLSNTEAHIPASVAAAAQQAAISWPRYKGRPARRSYSSTATGSSACYRP